MHCGNSSHERIQYGVVFPEAGNLNGSNADMCSDMAGPSTRGSGDLLEFSDKSNETIVSLFLPLLALPAAILGLSVTTTPILHSGRVIYVIVHKVYYFLKRTL